METDPKKLKGGQKSLWLKQNAPMILDYVAKYGKGTAMVMFNINHPDTLERLIQGDAGLPLPANSLEVQMAIGTARQAMESAKLAHIEIRGLAESYENFIESVAKQLTGKFQTFAEALLRQTFTLEGKPILIGDDELALNKPLPRLPRPKAPKKIKCNRELKATYLSSHPFAR